MNTVVIFCAIVVCTAAVDVPPIYVTQAMATRVDSQAWQVDQLTKQFQAISDKADASIAASKAGGDLARHLMNTQLKDTAECRPHTVRCGKSPQCVSVLAFCDGYNDCKNHYDEGPARCDRLVLVNTTWEAYDVFDECSMHKPIQQTYWFSRHPSSITYPGHQLLMVDLDMIATRFGRNQNDVVHVDGWYCMATRTVTVGPRPEDMNVVYKFAFDTVYNDRFVLHAYHLHSGDKCGEFRGFKQ